jgi:hypothetical protein
MAGYSRIHEKIRHAPPEVDLGQATTVVPARQQQQSAPLADLADAAPKQSNRAYVPAPLISETVIVAPSLPLAVLEAEISAERARLAELESHLRNFNTSNAQMTQQLDVMRSQNAELSARISTCAEDRSAAESRLAQNQRDVESVEAQQIALDLVR